MKYVLAVIALCLLGFVLAFGQGFGGKTGIGGKAGVGGGAASTTWAVVQQAISSGACTFSSATCNLTVASTGSGHLIVVTMGIAGTGEYITGVSGGGTYTEFAGNTCAGQDSSGLGTDCAYTLSSTSGATTITVTRTNTTSYAWRISMTELSSTAAMSLDSGCPQVRDQTTGTASPAGVTLTLAGANDVIIQNIWGGVMSAISSPYNSYASFSADLGTAASLNTLSGTAPTWTQASSKAALSAVCFSN
jgi:hypothetical protein